MRTTTKKKKGGGGGGLLPSSLRIISSCIKTVSSNATTVVSSVAASISSSASSDDALRDQVTWSSFDKLELGSSASRHVLLLGYHNGFQVIDIEDSSNFSELVSKRDGGRVNFLRLQPLPLKSSHQEGFRKSHPLLLVVAADVCSEGLVHNRSRTGGEIAESYGRNPVNSSTTVRFYSMRSHSYVHVLRFQSAVCMVRCSPAIVAVGLETQICCYDAVTLEKKFSVLTYPVTRLSGQERVCNIGYGPMALGPRWLAYASNNPLIVSTCRLCPQNVSFPGVSPSTSQGGGNLVARCAVESGRQLASGLVNLGDRGCRTISKYYQELLPDSSASPLLSSSEQKFMRLDSVEADNSGVVVVKDCVSRAVISQFRAHSSPLSALCFDPTGTLLATASVHGNNINIFRIMPSSACAGSGSQGQDWSSSYAHLYKLHRGLTTAVIQDICFSYSSQWVAVVSSKGTCHLFVISPFGGEVGFQNLNSQANECSLDLVMTCPWWSTSKFSLNQQPSLPPPPVSLSVVSRIRDGNSGLLNTVTNAAAVVAGKVIVPSGALTAVFHNSISSLRDGVSAVNPIEHLLVYTPSGHVVQHEIRPSYCTEQNGDFSRTQLGFDQLEGTELSVDIQSVQWWDVCRRSDWPEKEEQISEMMLHRRGAAAFLSGGLNYGLCSEVFADNKIERLTSGVMRMNSFRSREKANGHLSNAEVQYSSGRAPIWDNLKASFHVMEPPRCNTNQGGEVEIEKFTTFEVEIRRKDLLPFLDHCHGIESAWKCLGRHYPFSSHLEPPHGKDSKPEETVICRSKPASFSSTESSDEGLSRHVEHLLDMDHMPDEKAHLSVHHTSNENFHDRREGVDKLLDKQLAASMSFSHERQTSSTYFETARFSKYMPESETTLSSENNIRDCNQKHGDFLGGATLLENAEASNPSKICFENVELGSHVNVDTLSTLQHDLCFGLFHEDADSIESEPDGCSEPDEAAENAEASSRTNIGVGNLDDNDDDDDEGMIGCMFAEEG